MKKEKEFLIEDGVTVPKKFKPSKYDRLPLDKMNEGQSILLAKYKVLLSNSQYKKIYQEVWRVVKAKDFKDRKFKVAMIPSSTEKDIMEIRIWRVEL